MFYITRGPLSRVFHSFFQCQNGHVFFFDKSVRQDGLQTCQPKKMEMSVTSVMGEGAKRPSGGGVVRGVPPFHGVEPFLI